MWKKIKSLFHVIKHLRVTTVAGAWVYYFLLAVMPMGFLLLTAFNLLGVNVGLAFLSALPKEFSTAIGFIEQASFNVSKGVTFLFFVSVVISSTNLLNQMSKDGEFIYGMQSKIKRGYLRRIWALIALLILFLFFLSLALLFYFKNKFFGFKIYGGKRIILLFLGFASVIFISYILFYMLNVFISPVKMRFKEIAIGSLISISTVIIGTIAFIFYVKFFSSYNLFYGVLSGIIVLLLWAYLLMLGILFGVIVSMKLHYQSKIIG